MNRRDFLAAGLAAGAAPGLAFAAAAPLDASAARNARGLSLTWSAKSEPTSIFVSTDPSAVPAYMREARSGVRGGAAELSLAVTPRPYVLLRTRDGRETRVAERLLPLQGGRNFRDLGGYRAADGRQVRWGRIYRSGVMAGLTAQDLSYLSSLGVAVVCDLRAPQERQAEPSPFLKTRWPVVASADYDLSASLEALGRAANRAQAIAAFAQSYVAFIDTLTPQYADMFARLARGEAPLAVNCTAGKDRTGVASALILSVLGVPRETVIADYALTQVYTPPSLYAAQLQGGGTLPGLTREQSNLFRRLPREVIEVMMGSDPEIMRQALTAIDARYGGPIALAKARLGLTDQSIAGLRSTYLA